AELGTYWTNEFNQKVLQAQSATEKAVVELLEPAQERRLREIEMQQKEKQGANAILAVWEGNEKLGFTEEQRRKLEAIREDGAKIQKLISDERSFDPKRTQEDTATETLAKLAKKIDDQCAGVLTADQQAKLKKLFGRPFTNEVRTEIDRDPPL